MAAGAGAGEGQLGASQHAAAAHNHIAAAAAAAAAHAAAAHVIARRGPGLVSPMATAVPQSGRSSRIPVSNRVPPRELRSSHLRGLNRALAMEEAKANEERNLWSENQGPW